MNHVLRGLFRGLEALYGTESGIDPVHHLLPYQATTNHSQELVFFRQTDDDVLEIGLALDQATLHQLESYSPTQVLTEARLATALPIIEGLSHLLYLVEAARRERPISGLELETQAEVDKLALCLFHHRTHSQDSFRTLVDRLFYRFRIAANIPPSLKERYTTANRIALAFAQQLSHHIDRQRWSCLRRSLRHFWQATMQEKRALALSHKPL